MFVKSTNEKDETKKIILKCIDNDGSLIRK